MTIFAAALLAATFTRSMERVTTLDPALAQSAYEAQAIQLVCETPLAIDYRARPYRLVPGACELPEISADALTYTFRMRSRALTAGDVARSLERLRDREIVSPNSWILKRVGTIEAKDERTLVIRLTGRCSFFPWLMAMAQTGIRREDGSATGPYRLVSWWKNHEMRFERNPASDVKCDFDTVRYLVVDDASTQWLMFLRGELDLLSGISRDTWDAVVGPGYKLDSSLTERGIRLFVAPRLEVAYLGINMRDATLGPNKKLRQALNAAFDYPTWEKFYAGRSAPADGPVPTTVAGHLDEPFAYAYDLEKARRLIDEAGYPGGIDPKTGRRLVLTLALGRATQDTREMGELIASFYGRIGIRLELAYFTWDAFLKAVNEGRVQMFNMAWVGDYPDAENFLQLFHSSNRSPGPNHACYSNEDFDREYDAAMNAVDDETRNEHYRRAQAILREDCPWVFVQFGKSSTLVGPRVDNFVAGDFPYGDESRYRLAKPKNQ